MEIEDHQDLPTSEDEHDAGDEPAQTSISDAQDSASDNHREQETKSPKELGDVSLDVGTADADASEYDDEPMTFTDSTQQGSGAGWSPQVWLSSLLLLLCLFCCCVFLVFLL